MARLISLGLADIPAPARRPKAAQARPDVTEFGATGTPILSGFLSDIGEYSTEFAGGPFTAFKTFEKMRRSDAQVAATLAAIKLPIRSAKWEIRPPENPTPAERKAADFARECLLEAIDFDAVVRNALLMLDFGCAAHEDVWEIDGGRVRLAKMAPRLPHTFYRWVTAPDSDELVGLEQMGYRGSEYVTKTIPTEKLTLFTFEQEGSNYAGRSLLRAMYQSWYIKSNLYKIDAIAQERNGMGVPVITMADGAKKEDRDLAWSWVQQLSTHQRTGLVLPPGWTFKLEGVTGTTRDAKDSISHHNLQISMAGLAMFLTLGQTQTGARSLGETMSDFFSMSIMATANQVAGTIEKGPLKRLIDFNYTGVRYPKLVPQEILAMRFEALVAALKDLASSGVNIVQPDDETESWIRRKMGAPDAGKPRVRPAVPGPSGSTERPGGDAGGSADAGARLAGSQMERGGVVVDGVRVRREPKPYERCLALSEIVSALDRGRDEIAAACRAARSRIQAEIIHKLVNAPVRELHRVSIPPDAKLVTQVEGILQGIYEFGAGQVEAERQRQLGGAAPSDAAKIRGAVKPRKLKRTPLGVYADAVVSEIVNNLAARAVNVALDWMRRPGDLTKGEIIRNVESEIDAQSDKWIDSAASKGANEAFADGRADGYEEHADEIRSVIYSALLDINTCEFCAAADGEEGATPDKISDVPNPNCDGGDRCRCVHVFVFSDEGEVKG